MWTKDGNIMNQGASLFPSSAPEILPTTKGVYEENVCLQIMFESL